MNLQKLDEAFAGNLRRGNPMSLKEDVPLMRDETCIEFPVDQTTITRRYVDESILFVDQCVREEKPFFLYLANSMPHVPLFASPEFKGKSERGLYGDVIEEIDHHVGRLMDHLKAVGEEENTIVILLSDNGPWLIKGDLGGCALPLFEGKSTRFDGGQRVPAIIRWPGHVPAGSTCTEMALALDLLPTLADVSGADLPAAPIDGKNILDLIVGKPGAETPHRYFFFGDLAVRSGDWKYHSRERFMNKATKRKTRGPTLYNLKEDIGESVNLINDYPEVAERLKTALDQFNEQHQKSPSKTGK
jgi:arylsulfatase A-like enzyme